MSKAVIHCCVVQVADLVPAALLCGLAGLLKGLCGRGTCCGEGHPGHGQCKGSADGAAPPEAGPLQPTPPQAALMVGVGSVRSVKGSMSLKLLGPQLIN